MSDKGLSEPSVTIAASPRAASHRRPHLGAFSRLDAGVESVQKAKAHLRRYRQSVLKAAVEGKLTEEWRKEHPEVEPAEKLLERILQTLTAPRKKHKQP